MPLYEYECPEGHRDEVIFPTYNARPEKIHCSKCRQDSRPIISSPGFLVAGQEASIDTPEEAWAGMPESIIENAKTKKDLLRIKRQGAKITNI